MSGLGAVGYLAVFVGAVVLTAVLVPVALRVAVRFEAFDHPGGHKQHTAPVPYLGGLAIVVAFALAVLVAALLRPPEAGLDQLVAVLAFGVLISLVGLADDLRGVGVGARIAVLVVAALVLFGLGIRVTLPVPEVVNLLITIVWIVGITNAFNLLDNMDGLSAGVAAIGAVTFATVASLNGQFLVAALAFALAGCGLAFLVHNRHPARIYMGDAGSMFLGFVLAVLGIQITVPTDPVIAAFVPVLALGVAIADTTLVTVDRVRHQRSPFEGGRDHISHRLVVLGLPVRSAVWTIYAAGIVLGWLAVVMARLQDIVTAQLLLGLVVVVSVTLGVLLARVPVERPARPGSRPSR